MHAALGRAIEHGSAALSPAWSDVQIGAYPRGFSAWLAVVAAAVGYGPASIVVSGLGFGLYYFGLRAFLDRGLALPYPGLIAAFLALGSRTPQSFYGWGGAPTAMALGFGLLAAGELAGALDSDERRILQRVAAALVAGWLLVGGLWTHPIGACLGGLLCGVGLILRGRRSPLLAAGLGGVALLPVAPTMLWLRAHGPALSAHELAWITDFQLQSDNALGSWPAFMAPLTVWWAILHKVGPIVLIAFVLAAYREWRTPEGRRRVLGSLAAIELLSLFVAYGHRLPAIGFLIYPSRSMPLAVPALALPIAHALHAGQVPRKLLAGLGRVAALSALIYHVVLYQRALPIATADDVRAIACLERKLPADAVVDGAYGDATQWLPALTGHLVTHPHIHCSLFDEVERKIAARTPSYRFVGERLRYGAPLDAPQPSGDPVCEAGGARLYRLESARDSETLSQTP